MPGPTSTPKKKLTWDDFLLFPDDGKRHELIDGEHYVSPSPVSRHQAILGNLFAQVAPIVREQKLGRLYFAPLDVILSDVDVVEPDLLFVREERADIVQDWVRGAPDLLVEVLSPSTRKRDERLKRDLYERHGVTEYWIVDPEADTVKVYRLDDGVYGRPQLLLAERDDALTSPLFGETGFPLREIFRR